MAIFATPWSESSRNVVINAEMYKKDQESAWTLRIHILFIVPLRAWSRPL
jgi:hypothetical protein